MIKLLYIYSTSTTKQYKLHNTTQFSISTVREKCSELHLLSEDDECVVVVQNGALMCSSNFTYHILAILEIFNKAIEIDSQ